MRINKLILFCNIFLAIFIYLFIVSAAEPKIILKIDIPANYEKINQDDSLIVNSEVILLRENQEEIADIILEYTIYDSKGSAVTRLVETKGLILRLNTVKEIKLPSTIMPGVYTIEVKANYGAIKASNSDVFEILKIKKNIDAMYIILFLIFVLFLFAMYYEYRKFKYIEKLIKKVDERDLVAKGFLIKRSKE